jgi:hypothetical protein
MAMLPFAPQKHEEGQAPNYFEAWEYYHTPRAQHPNAPSIVPIHSLTRLVGYDAFQLADQLLTQPLRLIAGSKAGSLWFSQDAFKCAGSRDKRLHIVEGATHIAMYDTPEYVKEAMEQFVPLYQKCRQAFLSEQLGRAAERARGNGRCGINSVTSLRGMQFLRRQGLGRSALPSLRAAVRLTAYLTIRRHRGEDSNTLA